MNLQMQIVGLRQLLAEVGDDTFMASQIRERLEDAEHELAGAIQPTNGLFPPALSLARAAIFLSGNSAIGTEGISPQLAGEALIQYEKMFVAQAMDDERVAAREQGRQRRKRGTSKPSLLFTGTPRGSFGLEFIPRLPDGTQDDVAARIEGHGKSLRTVAETIIGVVESDQFDEVVKKVHREILAPLKSFLAALAKHNAEIRFAFPDQQRSQFLGIEKIRAASERLEREVVENTVKYNGVVRGVTLDTYAFDFRTDDGDVISGTVSPDLGDDDLERIHKLTNRPCNGQFARITINQVTGSSTEHILLNAIPLESERRDPSSAQVHSSGS